LALAQRQLDAAISSEDYNLAATLRDDIKVAISSLPALQQYMYHQVGALRSGSQEEKLKAILALGEVGDDLVVADLAAHLGDEVLGEAAQAAMWSIFTRNKDPAAFELLQDGVRLMDDASQYDRALAIFNTLTKLSPNYAESYNKRATLLYMMARFKDSIEDCKVVLRLQPHHFGAASGMGLCYLQLGMYPEAISAFEAALRIHPRLTNISKVLADLRRTVASKGSAAGGEGPAGTN